MANVSKASQLIIDLIGVLSCKRIPVANEKETQEIIYELFKEKNIAVDKEYPLDSNNIVDFYINGIAIEVKIKGTPKKIYKQCERYCSVSKVKALLLITSKTFGMPFTINNKPCYIYSLSKNWL